MTNRIDELFIGGWTIDIEGLYEGHDVIPR